jgi:hypothetical protein
MDIDQQIEQVMNKILEMGLSDVPKIVIDGELEHLRNLELIKVNNDNVSEVQ